MNIAQSLSRTVWFINYLIEHGAIFERSPFIEISRYRITATCPERVCDYNFLLHLGTGDDSSPIKLIPGSMAECIDIPHVVILKFRINDR